MLSQMQNKAIYVLTFLIITAHYSTSKTFPDGCRKNTCMKHRRSVKNSASVLHQSGPNLKDHHARPQKPTDLLTTLQPITKKPCTKNHTEKSTNLHSVTTPLTAQEHKSTAKMPTKKPATHCRPLDCVLSVWSKWTPCSATCGISGTKQRHRNVKISAKCGGVCPYRLRDTKHCNKVCLNGGVITGQGGCTCQPFYDGLCCEKSNGNWSPWEEWSRCTKTCGVGIQRRRRVCNQPAPSNGGRDCEGPGIETLDCNRHKCPVNGGWSEWGDWSQCSSSCGEGTKFRQRQCSNPFPSNGGQPCIGFMLLTAKCQIEPCKIPVDGGWSTWLEWSPCSKSCGDGSRFRTRFCNNPLPSDGGRFCSGSNQEREKCSERPCKIPGNGGSGAVGGMGKRNAKAAGHTSMKHRHLFKLLEIKGPKRRLLSEITDSVTNFDVLIQKHREEIQREDSTDTSGPWTSWSTCSTSCGAGQRFRTRACRDLASPCDGAPMEVQTCDLGKC